MGATASADTQFQEGAHVRSTWYKASTITDCRLIILQTKETTGTIQECFSQTHTVSYAYTVYVKYGYMYICILTHSHGTGVDEEEEEGQEGAVTAKERASSPTSAEMDLLVHIPL